MSAITFSRSFGQGFKKSLCQARTRGYKDAQCIMAVSAVPLWGYGTFNSAGPGTPSSYAITYNYVWPMVYTTKTENWTDGNGGNRTKITKWSPYYDIGEYVLSDSGSALNIFTGSAVPVVTATTITANGNDGSFVPVAVVYTVTLSDGPFDPRHPTNGWAALAIQADVNLALVTYADASSSAAGIFIGPNSQYNPATGYAVDPTVGAVMILPISTGSGTQIINAKPVFMCAAAKGIGIIGGTASIPPSQPHTIFEPSIQDFPNPITGFPSSKDTNIGFVVSIKSWWQLNGQPLYQAALNGWNANDHKTIYTQEMLINGGTGALSLSVVTVSPSYTNPITVPQQINFNPSDITTTYGILGFRSAAL